MTHSSIDKRKILASNIFFKQISSDDLDNIISFSAESHYKNTQIIFQKGQKGDSLLAVLIGKVKISNSSEEGKEIILNTIFPGEVFGEIAFIDGLERSATATAIGDCTLLSIQRRDFIPYLKKNPEIAIQLITVLCNKLRNTSDRVETVGLLPVSVSLARFLVKAGNTMGMKTEAGILLDWKKSQQEIGNEIGTSRESVNKQLNKWKKQGVLTLGGQSLSLTIVDNGALENAATGAKWE